MARCYNPRDRKWKWYGARGIGVCERWHTYENFVADMAPRPDGLTLERENNDLGYGPENCVWADMATQNKNKRKPQSALRPQEFPCALDDRVAILKRRSEAARRAAASRKRMAAAREAEA